MEVRVQTQNIRMPVKQQKSNCEIANQIQIKYEAQSKFA